ncbi:MAG TPA: T9SS type A sorting domain-containing protein [Chitinophagales bacterium]|nr:T9SS type A sorting domain-containing protein [Chitinophagales bacterium]
MVQTTFCSIQPPAGSGKTMSIQELYLRQTALQEQVPTAPIAQAINASYYGEVYYKNVKPATARQINNASLGQTLLTVYPNPAKNFVHFVMPTDGKQYRIIITNMHGKQIAAHLLENGKFVWNTDNLSSGLYFCALVKQNGEVVETHKLVIAR